MKHAVPPPIPPRAVPLKRHWTNTFWFGGLVTVVPVAVMVALAVAGVR